jgi:AcrR family transcriptional regulator
MPKVLPEYKEQATQRILTAAQKVFSEKGYHEARMEDIAERVGVSKRTLYLYFKNKEELFAAISAAAPQTMQKYLESTLGNVSFAEICEVFFDHVLSEPVTGLNYEIISAASRNPVLKKTIKELYEKENGVLADFLENLKKKGGLQQHVDTSVLARAIIALYDGLIANLVIGVDKSDVRKAWLEATRSLVNETSNRRVR